MELSKNYDKLFDILQSHDEEALGIPCYVNYLFYSDRNKVDAIPSRDIAKIRKYSSKMCDVGVRGMAYGDLDLRDKPKFFKECQRMNLEYVI